MKDNVRANIGTIGGQSGREEVVENGVSIQPEYLECSIFMIILIFLLGDPPSQLEENTPPIDPSFLLEFAHGSNIGGQMSSGLPRVRRDVF